MLGMLASCACAAGAGSVSGKWHAAKWVPPNGRIGGSSAAQMSCARGQRVRNRQPDGGSIADGSSPATPLATFDFSTTGSAFGMVSIRPRV